MSKRIYNFFSWMMEPENENPMAYLVVIVVALALLGFLFTISMVIYEYMVA